MSWNKHPDFSWSISRHSMFKQCQRMYYYNYYGYHNGWLSKAPEEAQMVYRLKKLQLFKYLTGSIIHDGIAVFLNSGRMEISAGELAQPMLSRLDRCIRESADQTAWIKNLKRRTMILEVYYDGPLAEQMISMAREQIVRCCEHFLNSRSYRFAKTASFMKPEVPDSFESIALSMDVPSAMGRVIRCPHIKAFVISDLLYRDDDGLLWIVDWKSGGDFETVYRQQLLVYAYCLSGMPEYQDNKIAGRLEFLNKGEYREFVFSRDEITSVGDFIAKSVGDMFALLKDPSVNEPKNMADFARNTTACHECSFRAVCR